VLSSIADTLNHVLNGVWQPTTLDRVHLERLLAPADTKSTPAQSTPSTQPLHFGTIVAEWNDSLLKMQGVLAQYLQRQLTLGY
jgi:hypothetical protein